MDFLSYLSQKIADTPNESLTELIKHSGGVDRVYLVFVDILKGFCEQGPLSSERVNEMVEPVISLSDQLVKQGIPMENVVFLNDSHPEDAAEFSAFAPHCMRDTVESEVVDALQPLQQTKGVQTFLKNSTNGMFGTNQKGLRFFEFLEEVFTKGKSTFIIVGDCTDLCIYQNAMGIRLFANERNAEAEVIVPVSHVKTYDMSIEQAEQLNIYAHDADFLDSVFLYHMKMNGIRVISTVK